MKNTVCLHRVHITRYNTNLVTTHLSLSANRRLWLAAYLCILTDIPLTLIYIMLCREHERERQIRRADRGRGGMMRGGRDDYRLPPRGRYPRDDYDDEWDDYPPRRRRPPPPLYYDDYDDYDLHYRLEMLPTSAILLSCQRVDY